MPMNSVLMMANLICETLVQDESENVFVEANNEQKSLPPLHKDWLTEDEQIVRDDQNINNEVMKRIQCRDNY